MKKEGYHRALRDGKLSYSAVNKLLDFMKESEAVSSRFKQSEFKVDDKLKKRLKSLGYIE